LGVSGLKWGKRKLSAVTFNPGELWSWPVHTKSQVRKSVGSNDQWQGQGFWNWGREGGVWEGAMPLPRTLRGVC